MLRRAEDIPITLTRELDTFEQLIAQVQEPLPSHEFTLTDSFNDLIEESLARGWIYSASLQELLAAMDPRLAGLSIDGLAQVFERDRTAPLPCAMPPFCSFSSRRWASGSMMRRSAPG
jgi:hypothetical protein